MRVLRDLEIAPEGVNPVLRFAQEILVLFVLLGFLAAMAGGNDFLLLPGILVEDGRIIAAVKINVGHGEELVGEQLAAVAEHQGKDVVRPAAPAPAGRIRRQP